MKKILVITPILFLIFIAPSLAIKSEQLTSMILNENYTTIVIEIPEFLYQPENWNTVYNNVKRISNFFQHC